MKVLGFVVLLGVALQPSKSLAQSVYTPYAFTNYAGVPGSIGTNDGPAATAKFSPVQGVAVDSTGAVFVADYQNATIRRISPDGIVSTIAGAPIQPGTADGVGPDARFGGPTSIAIDATGKLYVCDTGVKGYNGNTIRVVTPTATNWIVSTLAGAPGVAGNADGTGSSARFSRPMGIAMAHDGNFFVADYWNSAVRRVTPDGTVSTIARVYTPTGIGISDTGVLYVADAESNAVRTVSLSGTNWVVGTLAGGYTLPNGHGSADGFGTNAFFYGPSGIALDHVGNIYTCDQHNYTVRRITPTGTVTTVAGVPRAIGKSDGVGASARFSIPAGLAFDEQGNLYVADYTNKRVTKGVPVLQFDIRADGVGVTESNSIHWRILGPNGSNVIVWTSTDLSNWSPDSTNTLGVSGFDFDTVPKNQSTMLKATLAP